VRPKFAADPEAVDDPMPKTPFPLPAFWGRVLVALAALIMTAPPAAAQFIAAMVNGEPVTNYDIEQRIKLISVATQKNPTRKEVLEELIDEKLKTQLIRRYNIEGIDKDVDNALTNMARRGHSTPKQFEEQLSKSGINIDTLKSRVRAEIAWSQVIRGRYQSSFQFSEKDVAARLESRSEAAPAAHEYTLRPILFVVRRGSPPPVIDARRKEAEALRARFQGCEEGVPLARGLRDVAVRAVVVKNSGDLAPALREILDKTELGKLTAPELTQQGVEVYAVCAKKPVSVENATGKREVREKLFSEQFEGHSKRLIKELRSQAMIEYR
jgi:peptidyl-prolyl cis-trans isomerase SurA